MPVRVQRQQLLHQVESNTRLENFVLTFALVGHVSFKASVLIDRVAGIEIKQGTRRDADRQRSGKNPCPSFPGWPWGRFWKVLANSTEKLLVEYSLFE